MTQQTQSRDPTISDATLRSPEVFADVARRFYGRIYLTALAIVPDQFAEGSDSTLTVSLAGVATADVLVTVDFSGAAGFGSDDGESGDDGGDEQGAPGQGRTQEREGDPAGDIRHGRVERPRRRLGPSQVESHGLAANLRTEHVPYKESARGVLDLAEGRLPVMVVGANSFIEMHKAGRIRMLAVSGEERSARAPEVPTLVLQCSEDVIAPRAVAHDGRP